MPETFTFEEATKQPESSNEFSFEEASQPAEKPIQITPTPYEQYRLAIAKGATPENYSELPSLAGGVWTSRNPDLDFVRAAGPVPYVLPAFNKAMEVAGEAAVGLMDIPTKYRNAWIGAEDPENPMHKPTLAERTEGGRNIITFPHAPSMEGEGTIPQVAEGIANLAADTATSFFGRPQSAVLLAATPGEGALGKIISTGFGASTAAQVPAEIAKAFDVVNDPKSTTAEKTAAIGSPLVQGLFAKTMLKHGMGGLDALNNAKAATVHGDVLSLARESQRQMSAAQGGEGVQPPGAQKAQVSLSPEHSALLEPHMADDRGVFTTLPDNRVMRANHETGQVEVDPAQFAKWVDNDLAGLSDKAKKKAVQGAFDEEDIHLKTPKEDGEPFWNSLSPFEQAILKRQYLKGGGEETPANLGMEAIRNRIERANKMTRNDFVGLALHERWTAQALDHLAAIVSKIRRAFDKELSAHQDAILNKVQENIKAARSAVAAPGAAQEEGPFMMRRADGTPEDDLNSELPPLHEGERVVLVRRPDGSVYRASYAGKQYDVSAGGKAMIEKYGGSKVDSVGRVDERGQWSHGILKPGEKIIKGFSPYAAVERSGGPEGGPAMRRTVSDVPEDDPRRGYYDFSYYEERLRQPELLKDAIPVFGKPDEGGLLAVPVGGDRKSGSLGCAELFDKEQASEIADQLRGKKGFPDVRVTKMPRGYEEFPEMQYQVEWGKPIDWETGWDEVEGPNEYYHDRLGDQFGYHPSYDPRIASGRRLEDFPQSTHQGTQQSLFPDMPAMRRRVKGSEEELPGFKAVTAKGVPGQEQEAVPATELGAPKKQYGDYQVTPGKIDLEQLNKKSQTKGELPFRFITPSEAKKPGDFLVSNARLEGSDLPVSSSRRLTALFDNQTGEVHLVSTYKGDNKIRMVDPEQAGKERPNKPAEDLLERYTPIYSMLLQEPVQNFHEAYPNLEEFQRQLATPVKELQRMYGTGTEGIPKGSIGEGEEQFSTRQEREPNLPRPTTDELQQFHDFFGDTIPSDREQFEKRLMQASGKANRRMISGLEKLMDIQKAQNRGWTDRDALDQVLDDLYENITKSETRSDFVKRTLAQGRLSPLEADAKIKLYLAALDRRSKSGARNLTALEFQGPRKPATGTGVEPTEAIEPTSPEYLPPGQRAVLEAEIEKEHNVLTPERSNELMQSIASGPTQKERYRIAGEKSIKDLEDSQVIEDDEPDMTQDELFPGREMMSEQHEDELVAAEGEDIQTKAVREKLGRTKEDTGMRKAVEKAMSAKRQGKLDIGKPGQFKAEQFEFPQHKLTREIRELRQQLESAPESEKPAIRDQIMQRVVEHQQKYGEIPWNEGPAMRRRMQDVKEDTAKAVVGINAYLKRKASEAELAATRDALDNKFAIAGDQADKAVRLVSADKKMKEGNPQVLKAAPTVVQAGAYTVDYPVPEHLQEAVNEKIKADPLYKNIEALFASDDRQMKARGGMYLKKLTRKIVLDMVDDGTIDWRTGTLKYNKNAANNLQRFSDKLDVAEMKARKVIESTGGGLAGMLDRRAAKARLKAVADMREQLQYAREHWNDQDLQDTASKIVTELEVQHRHERDMGMRVKRNENYLPGRYDEQWFDGDRIHFMEGPRILGRSFRKPATFNNYYDAIAAGNYLPFNMDGASLVGHRVRQGMQQVETRLWTESLKALKDPYSGKPLVMDVKRDEKGNALAPTADYEVVKIGNQDVAVQKGSLSVIRALTGESEIREMPLSRWMMQLNQKMKHTILFMDTFHLGRLKAYDWSINGIGKGGYKQGLSVLEYRPEDVPEAVRKGLLTQEHADWANGRVQITGRDGQTTDVSRRQIAEQFIKRGLNVGRIADAIYKVEGLGVIGKYNRWLFDKMTRGMMLETAVKEFERQMGDHPDLYYRDLIDDISRDTNNYMGSIGRQGWIKNQTFQDAFRLFGLAPQWVEGLIKKETALPGRLTGLSYLAGRRNVPLLGTAGRGIARGLATMFVLTQVMNLITRRKPTWENEEEGHKWDAYIPDVTGKSPGFFMSPLSLFNEITHDIIRLTSNKPTVYDALHQIGENKLGPYGRALMVLFTGETPSHRRLTSTGAVAKEVGKQLIPVPISLGKLAQLGASAAGLMQPPAPGSVQRQTMASLGVKTEPAPTANSEIYRKADRFIQENDLQRGAGWQQEQTDQLSYSDLRSAAQQGDKEGFKAALDHLRKSRTDGEIYKAMNQWKGRAFTGSKATEKYFLADLTDQELDLYSRAREERQHTFNQFEDMLFEDLEKSSSPSK